MSSEQDHATAEEQTDKHDRSEKIEVTLSATFEYSTADFEELTADRAERISRHTISRNPDLLDASVGEDPEPRFVRPEAVPNGWERTIGRNRSIPTTYSDSGSWFDVVVYESESTLGKYDIVLKRGPNHPHQDEIDEPLQKRVGVSGENVEQVATGFMLCGDDMDPFTNKFSRGYRISE